ncbi:MAG TPA: hypothetical protein GX708_01190 [Gallicola sp.]|nr:hypothetical protein [Gallicola sp.]
MSEENKTVVNETEQEAPKMENASKGAVVENKAQEQTSKVESKTIANKKEQTTKKYDFNELMKDKEFVREYDRRVGKAINTAIEKRKKEIETQFKNEYEAKTKSYTEEYAIKEKSLNEQLNYSNNKIEALSKGVKSDFIEDVVILANNYVSEELDFDKALEQVLEKYPYFKGTENNKVIKAGTPISKEPKTSGKTLAELYIEKNYR